MHSAGQLLVGIITVNQVGLRTADLAALGFFQRGGKAFHAAFSQHQAADGTLRVQPGLTHGVCAIEQVAGLAFAFAVTLVAAWAFTLAVTRAIVTGFKLGFKAAVVTHIIARAAGISGLGAEFAKAALAAAGWLVVAACGLVVAALAAAGRFVIAAGGLVVAALAATGRFVIAAL